MNLVDAPSVFFGAMRDFLRTWPRMFATDFVFKLVAFALLTPLVGVALRGFVSLSGKSLLADQDILRFVLSPLGIAALIVVAAAVIAIAAFEQAGLLTIAFGAIRERHIRVGGALWATAGHAFSILTITALLVARVLLVAIPFLLAAGVVFWLFLTEFDINYYLTERPTSFWVAGILITGLLAAMSALIIPRLVGWVYALPLHLFENVGALKALGASEERARGHRATITVLLVGWATFAALLSALSVALVRGLGFYLVPRFRESIGSLLFVMGGLALVWIVVNLFATLFQAATLALLTARLYERVGGSEAAEAPGMSDEATVEGGGFRLTFGTVLGGLSIAAALCGGIGYYLLDRVKIDHEVIAIGHRGAAGRAPRTRSRR